VVVCHKFEIQARRESKVEKSIFSFIDRPCFISFYSVILTKSFFKKMSNPIYSKNKDGIFDENIQHVSGGLDEFTFISLGHSK
jgi:hypothetical protein